jgi:hypothetical protein
VSGFSYRLVVTTDGRPGLLDRTLAAFDTHARPAPADTVIVDDSGDPEYRGQLAGLLAHRPALIHFHPARVGFCQTVADAWQLATEPGPPFVFWLEDDILLQRDLDLSRLARVLDAEPLVAQMGLMRQPVNQAERQAGSLYALFRDLFTPRGQGEDTWLESRTNWSTTCSLIRRRFMVEHPWPAGGEGGCEGVYSRGLLDARFHFGVWGSGEERISHVGERGGHSY